MRTYSPPHFQIAIGPETSKRAFHPTDRADLEKTLAKLNGNVVNNDDVLAQAVALVDQRVRAHLLSGPRAVIADPP